MKTHEIGGLTMISGLGIKFELENLQELKNFLSMLQNKQLNYKKL